MAALLRDLKEYNRDQFMDSQQWGSIHWHGEKCSKALLEKTKAAAWEIGQAPTWISSLFKAVMQSRYRAEIHVVEQGENWIDVIYELLSVIGIGSPVKIYINPLKLQLSDGTPGNLLAMLVHELLGHGYYALRGRNFIQRRTRELVASAIENRHRSYMKIQQRRIYGMKDLKIPIPQYHEERQAFMLNGLLWQCPHVKEFL